MSVVLRYQATLRKHLAHDERPRLLLCLARAEAELGAALLRRCTNQQYV